MRALESNVKYLLNNKQQKENGQVLVFFNQVKIGEEYITTTDGVDEKEVLKTLIARLESVQEEKGGRSEKRQEAIGILKIAYDLIPDLTIKK